MNKLYYSPLALSDLDDIWRYIHNELQSPAAALKTVSSVLDTVEKLRDFSELGPKLSSITYIDSDYRYLVCGKYITFYRVSGDDVYIDRILYGRRDYLRILFGEME
jgi:addiction module RelE/StbE family toxin